MTHYYCPEDIINNGTPVSGDTVRLGTRNYTVHDHFLSIDGFGSNDAYFRELGINEDEKYTVASNAYGYTTTTGDWPEYHSEDYEALGRLLITLWNYQHQEEETTPTIPVPAQAPIAISASHETGRPELTETEATILTRLTNLSSRGQQRVLTDEYLKTKDHYELTVNIRGNTTKVAARERHLDENDHLYLYTPIKETDTYSLHNISSILDHKHSITDIRNLIKKHTIWERECDLTNNQGAWLKSEWPHTPGAQGILPFLNNLHNCESVNDIGCPITALRREHEKKEYEKLKTYADTEVPKRLLEEYPEKIERATYDEKKKRHTIHTKDLKVKLENTNNGRELEIGTYTITIDTIDDNEAQVNITRDNGILYESYTSAFILVEDEEGPDDEPITVSKTSTRDIGGTICYGSATEEIKASLRHNDAYLILKTTLELLTQPRWESETPYADWNEIAEALHPDWETCAYCGNYTCDCELVECAEGHNVINVCDECNKCEYHCECTLCNICLRKTPTEKERFTLERGIAFHHCKEHTIDQEEITAKYKESLATTCGKYTSMEIILQSIRQKYRDEQDQHARSDRRNRRPRTLREVPGEVQDYFTAIERGDLATRRAPQSQEEEPEEEVA